MTKQIARHWGKPAVRVKGSGWATLGSLVLLVVGLLLVIAAFYTPLPDAWFVLTFGIVAVVGAFVAGRRGKTRNHYIKAMVSAQNVPGGTHVVVLDVRGERHELVMSEQAAVGLAQILSESTPTVAS
jgi:hypothetical protein